MEHLVTLEKGAVLWNAKQARIWKLFSAQGFPNFARIYAIWNSVS